MIMLEEDVPVTRKARFVRVGQIAEIRRRENTGILVSVDLTEMRNGGCYALVSADPAGETLRPGPVAIWAGNDGRSVRLAGPASVVEGDWLWWERVER